MHYFDIGMKVVHELEVAWSTVEQQKNVEWMSFSKQYFSTSGIKWWKNQSWKMACVTQALGLLFHTTGSVTLGYVFKGSWVL